jgi:hypothetical protein
MDIGAEFVFQISGMKLSLAKTPPYLNKNFAGQFLRR